MTRAIVLTGSAPIASALSICGTVSPLPSPDSRNCPTAPNFSYLADWIDETQLVYLPCFSAVPNAHDRLFCGGNSETTIVYRQHRLPAFDGGQQGRSESKGRYAVRAVRAFRRSVSGRSDIAAPLSIGRARRSAHGILPYVAACRDPGAGLLAVRRLFFPLWIRINFRYPPSHVAREQRQIAKLHSKVSP